MDSELCRMNVDDRLAVYTCCPGGSLLKQDRKTYWKQLLCTIRPKLVAMIWELDKQ